MRVTMEIKGKIQHCLSMFAGVRHKRESGDSGKKLNIDFLTQFQSVKEIVPQNTYTIENVCIKKAKVLLLER